MRTELHNAQKISVKILEFLKSKKGILTSMSLCLVLLFAFSGFSYAKYYTNKENERETNIAVFDVSDDVVDIERLVEVNSSIVVKVTNKSEVRIRYFLQVKNVTGNIPLQFTCPEAYIAANTTTPVDYTITVSFQDGTSDTTQYIGMVDCVKLSVVAEQAEKAEA